MNFKSQIFSKYLADTETSYLFSDEVLIEKILLFEIALAKAQVTLNIIPADAYSEIKKVLTDIKISPTDLTNGTLQNGVPIISILHLAKSKLSQSNVKYLHFGATSQDAMDTALALILKESLALINVKLDGLIQNLRLLSEKYGDTPCMARTRGQLAAPMLFRHKVDAWLRPLERQERRFQEVASGVTQIQLGGAVGDLSSYKDRGVQLQSALASVLKLAEAQSWHTQRDNLCTLTSWMAITSGILGKMGFDILVMAQPEIGEVLEDKDGGGTSSAMPHKRNPVLSEALVAFGRLNAGLQSIQLNSLIHANERDGSAWILEWECIPQMVINTVAGINHATTISEKIQINTENMKENVSQFELKKVKK